MIIGWFDRVIRFGDPLNIYPRWNMSAISDLCGFSIFAKFQVNLKRNRILGHIFCDFFSQDFEKYLPPKFWYFLICKNRNYSEINSGPIATQTVFLNSQFLSGILFIILARFHKEFADSKFYWLTNRTRKDTVLRFQKNCESPTRFLNLTLYCSVSAVVAGFGNSVVHTTSIVSLARHSIAFSTVHLRS